MPIGELLALGAALSWAIGLTLFRVPLRERGADEVNFFKCCVGTLLFWAAAVALSPAAPLGGFELDQIVLLVASGIVGLSLGDSFLFMAVARLGGTRAIMLQSLNPIFTVAIAWVGLQEHLDLLKLGGVLAAVAGTVMVVADRGGSGRAHVRGRWQVGVLGGLLAALGQALGLVLLRLVTTDMDVSGKFELFLPLSAVRLTGGAAALLAWSLLRYPRRVLPMFVEARAWRQMGIATLIGTFLGILFMNASTGYAIAGVVSALTSTTPIFLMAIGVVFLRERYGLLSALGVAFGVAGIAALMLV